MFEHFVLVGGKSSRMGTPKGLLELGGKTFIERAADALGNQVNLVFADKTQSQLFDAVLPLAPRIFDVFPNCGALGAVHAALLQTAQNQKKWAVIAACDFPFANAELFAELKSAALADADCDAVIPMQNDGQKQTLCACYRVENCLQAAARLLESHLSSNENRAPSMREFSMQINIRLFDTSGLPFAEQLFFNVNTPPDYERAKQFCFNDLTTLD